MANEIVRYDLANDKIGLLAHVKGGVRYIWPDKLTELEKWIHQILTEREQMKTVLEEACLFAGLFGETSTPESPDIQPEEKPKADDWVVSFVDLLVDLLKERVRICENKIEHLEERAEENSDY